MEYTLADLRTPPPPRWRRFGQQEFTDWLDESMSWKESCYIGDWSFLYQFRVTGPDALRLLSTITVNTFERFGVGQSKHAIHVDQEGRLLAEGVLTKFAEDDYMIHGRGGFWARHRASKDGYDVRVEQDDWFVFQVSGPASLRVLDKAAGPNTLRDTRRMWHTDVVIAGHPVHALRQGMAGEVGFELQGPAEHGPEVYAAIVAAGAEFGLRRLGGRVAPINHLEAGFPSIVRDYLPAILDPRDADMAEYADAFIGAVPPFAHVAGSYRAAQVSDYYRNPVELGWGRNIAFDHDFIGSDALAAELAAPGRRLRTLVWNPDDVVDVYRSLFEPGENYAFMDMPRDQRDLMWADAVVADGQAVGVSTSRGYSYYFRQMISLAVLDLAHADLGDELTVVWGQPGSRIRDIRVRVAPAPYKPDRSRGDLRASEAGADGAGRQETT